MRQTQEVRDPPPVVGDRELEEAEDPDGLIFLDEAARLPAPAVLDQIAAFIGEDKALEVGAGAGVLARALADRGVDIAATDRSPNAVVGVPVREMMADDAVQEYSDRAVLVLSYVGTRQFGAGHFVEELIGELIAKDRESLARAFELFRGSKIVIRTGSEDLELPMLARLGFRTVRSFGDEGIWFLVREERR